MRSELHSIASGLLAATAVALAGAGCGGGDTIRIGVLTDCQGPFHAFEDAELSGAVLPFLQRGARLEGKALADGVTPVRIGGREVELVRGCAETGEHTVFIEEARRLVEQERVDAIVGGAGVVIRDVARRYPNVPFLSVFWSEQEVTLRRPAANVYRFTPDYGQLAAGLGTYAYRQLGWRRAAILAGDQQSGWGGAAAFTAEFCALGGEVVQQVFRSPFSPGVQNVPDALEANPDGVAAFLTSFDAHVSVLGALLRRLGDPAHRLVLWSANLEDGALLQTLGPRLNGVAATSWLPATPPSKVLRDYRMLYRASFPAMPAFFADQSWVIDYYNAVHAVLTALEHVDGDLSGDRRRLREELGRLRIDLPGGVVSLDANRQAVRDIALVRIAAGAKGTELHPLRSLRDVEQSFGGLLSSAPAPSRDSQPCKRAKPPPWAR